MPMFRKPSFKASRKIPDRRTDAGATNTELVDRASLSPGIDYDQNPIEITLGGFKTTFKDGEWLFNNDGNDSDVPTVQSAKEMQKMRNKLKGYEEENNLLKYKMELLLDMIAVSNSDMDAMQNELEKLREFKDRNGSKSPRR